MKVTPTSLAGVLLVEPRVFGDDRGWFYESYHRLRYAEHGMDGEFTQANVSRSVRGVLRGLHYQWPRPQAKLVSVLVGEVYDVAVDIRHGSPTFGQWTAAVLSADNHRQLWIPEGFAHGFAVLSEEAIFSYQCSDIYQHDADASLRYDDASFAIDWPVSNPVLSEKDLKAPFLADVDRSRLPAYKP